MTQEEALSIKEIHEDSGHCELSHRFIGANMGPTDAAYLAGKFFSLSSTSGLSLMSSTVRFLN